MQKIYNQKTIHYAPKYLKYAAASFVQELRKLTDSENIDDLTVDVLNGITHILIESSCNPDSEVKFNIDDLLFIKGLKASKNQFGNRGGYRESQRKEIVKQLELLSNLKINASNSYIPSINKYGKRYYKHYSGESPLFYIRKAENNDYCFYIKASETLAVTLKGIGAKTGLINKKILEYDYYRNIWEKRIGNYLSWLWRVRQNKGDFLIPIKIETLIIQIYKENEFKRANYIRNRLEKALYKLEDDGIIRSWQYTDIDETVLTGKLWIKTWLKHQLIIEPPVEIIQEYSKIKKYGKKSPIKFDFQELIEKIKNKKISLLKASEEIKITPNSLSGIISGKTSPNSIEKRKITNWLSRQKD